MCFSVLLYREYKNGKHLFGCGDDLKIRGWDVKTGKLLVEMSGHFSKVTGLAINNEENVLLSCARDKVSTELIMWWTILLVQNHIYHKILGYESENRFSVRCLNSL